MNKYYIAVLNEPEKDALSGLLRCGFAQDRAKEFIDRAEAAGSDAIVAPVAADRAIVIAPFQGGLCSWKALMAAPFLFQAPDEAMRFASEVSVALNATCAVFQRQDLPKAR
ncbi:MAG TPA: hypothetical protein VN782_15975 [Usitatibacter sp.]|nr:hypothetical protein [Usitatibacter sp.]